MANVGNWVSERTSTTGTGDITLVGGYQGQVPFAKAFSAGAVYYSILDGDNRECGTGSFNGTDLLARDTLTATYESGVYNDTNPTPINLSGNAIVSCTYNAAAFDTQTTNAALAVAATQTTNSDVLLTHADVVLTHADASQTALDAQATSGDVSLTHADALQTASDRTQTGLDAQTASTAAGTATNAVVTTTSNASATNIDYTNTHNDYLSFSTKYLGEFATNPAVDNQGNPLVTGALFFKTAVGFQGYNGTAWADVGSTVNGVERSQPFVATAGQTTFTITNGYDIGFIDVFKQGMLLNQNEYVATNGTTVVLNVAASLSDSIYVQAYGQFALADHYTKTVADSLRTATNTVNTPAGNIASTDVQAAINELDVEKEPADATILKQVDIGTTVQAYDADLFTVAINGVGTGANQIVQLDASAKLPAVDGSQLTGLSAGLGSGQTWQNLLASRVNNTNYPNSTGRSIYVTASTGITNNHSLYGYIDNVLICHMGLDIGASIYNSLSMIVPAGSTYRFNSTANNITTWMELR